MAKQASGTDPAKGRPDPAGEARRKRLKAALKANMAKRKAQLRARRAAAGTAAAKPD